MAVEKQVNVIISAIDEYSSQMAAFGMSWNKIALTAAAVEAAIIAASIAAAKFTIDIGKDLVMSAADFHDAMYDVVAVAQSFGTTSEDIDKILTDLTIKFPLTGEQAGAAMQLIAQMGYGGKEALSAMAEAAVTLQIATGADLQIAAKGTMAIMNMFNLELEESDRVINLLAQVSFTSAASVADLSEAMKYAGPITSSLGISLEETAAALGMLKDQGLEASQTGTVLRMALAQLLKETNKGAAALANYGLAYADVNPEVHSLAEIIGAFQGQSLSATDAVKIFGVRAMTIAPLINKGAEAFVEYTNEITGTTAAYDAMTAKMNTWRVVQDMLAGDLDVMKKTIGIDLLTAVIDFIGKDEHSGLRGIITKIRELEEIHGTIGGPLVDTFKKLRDVASEVFGESFGDVEGFYDWLSLISEVLGKNLEILGIWGGELAKVFIDETGNADALKTALQVLNTVIGGIAIVVAAVHDVFAGLWDLVMYGVDIAQAGFASWMMVMNDGLVTIFELIDMLPFVDMTEEIKDAAKAAEFWKEEYENAFSHEPVQRWTDNVVSAMITANSAIEEFGTEAKTVNKVIEETAVDLVDWGKELEGTGIIIKEKVVPATKEVAEATEEAKKSAEGLAKEVEKTKQIELKLQMEQYKADIDLAKEKVKELSDLTKTKIEWEAKINIANVEANAERVKAAFDSIAVSVTAASEASSDMMSIWSGFDALTPSAEVHKMERWIDDQMQIQRDLADAQISLTEAETNRIEIQTQLLESGEMAPLQVRIEGDIEGWLSGLVQSLFDEIMIKAQAEAFSCLCQ